MGIISRLRALLYSRNVEKEEVTNNERVIVLTPEQQSEVSELTTLIRAYAKAGRYQEADDSAQRRQLIRKGTKEGTTLYTLDEYEALRTSALQHGSAEYLYRFAERSKHPIEEREVVACIRVNIERYDIRSVSSAAQYLRGSCSLTEQEADALACRQEQLMQEYFTNRSYIEALIEYSNLLSSVTEVGRDALVRTVGWYVERCLPEWESAREQRLAECASEREKLVYAIGLVRAYGAPADTIDKLITFAFRVSRPREEMDATSLAWRLPIHDHMGSVLHHVTKVVFRLSCTSRVAFVRECIARGYWKDWWLFRREWQLPEDVVDELISLHIQRGDENTARNVAQKLRDDGHGRLTPQEIARLAEVIAQGN